MGAASEPSHRSSAWRVVKFVALGVACAITIWILEFAACSLVLSKLRADCALVDCLPSAPLHVQNGTQAPVEIRVWNLYSGHLSSRAFQAERSGQKGATNSGLAVPLVLPPGGATNLTVPVGAVGIEGVAEGQRVFCQIYDVPARATSVVTADVVAGKIEC